MTKYEPNYKPFWTEQTTTETISKSTEEPTVTIKYANNEKLFVFASLILFIIIYVGIVTDNYYKDQKELEFVKAGLVQKVENGKVIWTKP